MTGPREAAQATLDGIVQSAGLLGAGIVSRDGLPILLRFKRPVQEETFCAMAAALFGAAEAALQEMSASAPASAVVDTNDVRLQVAGIDDTHLLIVVAPTAIDSARMLGAVEQAIKALRATLGG